MSVLRVLRTIVSRSGSVIWSTLRRLGQVLTLGVASGFFAGMAGLAAVMFVAEYFGLL